ncbi:MULTISPECIES: Lsr2 family protein [unclassified Allobranchiibius]|uniref:histone-like nucleoid-structuring protein Lsr2 n=1 Tax=unclassified Allobranchiibius TaxID=2649857 RepID=UPI001AA0B4A8|nr:MULTISPECIES: Lsr2 family protein [unclassified Allobranchiibius]MBO1766068.1 Lsr2 family protein [Allobranchiibius sp. GilTou38]UIJ35030.1 Lsr2 family protein [Allobranchiibius sp. GilTou73]
MAQRVQILLEDDLDHSEAAETVTFALDGVNYEIDLSAANAARLRDDLATWTGHARKVRGARKATTARASSGSTAGRDDLNKIREWGRANGFTVSDRGRVSGELQTAYAEANS